MEPEFMREMAGKWDFKVGRKVKPLTGQVLIEILPPDAITPGGIEIPNRSLSPEEVQERSHNPEKPPPWQGIVVAVGKWPTLPNGMALMPEFGKGARVVIRHNAGTPMQRGISEKLRMVRQSDILAVLT